MRLSLFPSSLLLLSSAVPSVLGWGAVGHEMVATIAQAYLTPKAQAAIKNLLPEYTKGSLVSIATWADSIRYRMPETGVLHYINPNEDNPYEHCEFGEHGWVNSDHNVVTAIANYTKRLMDGTDGDLPLKFLVHFLGDMHQPLHLTGRLKGGNGAIVKFEGRRANLHSAWDGLLIQKHIRELQNYTTPTPSRQIESVLTGHTYDPYLRFIMFEGIGQWWKEESLTWTDCPTSIRSSSSYLAQGLPDVVPPLSVQGLTNSLLKAYNPFFSFGYKLWTGRPAPTIPKPINKLPDWVFDDDLPACPLHWATPLHQLNCDYVWPVLFNPNGPPLELDTSEYWGRIKGDFVIEKLLAMGGIRLAAVLNSVFV